MLSTEPGTRHMRSERRPGVITTNNSLLHPHRLPTQCFASGSHFLPRTPVPSFASPMQSVSLSSVKRLLPGFPTGPSVSLTQSHSPAILVPIEKQTTRVEVTSQGEIHGVGFARTPLSSGLDAAGNVLSARLSPGCPPLRRRRPKTPSVFPENSQHRRFHGLTGCCRVYLASHFLFAKTN